LSYAHPGIPVQLQAKVVEGVSEKFTFLAYVIVGALLLVIVVLDLPESVLATIISACIKCRRQKCRRPRVSSLQ
jgi:VIT1/CCC1 family predicted Fe2+/Mn2+ transporter